MTGRSVAARAARLSVWRETDPEVLAGLYGVVSEQLIMDRIIQGYGLTSVDAWLEWCRSALVFAVSADGRLGGFVALKPIGPAGGNTDRHGQTRTGNHGAGAPTDLYVSEHWELHACRLLGLGFGDACRALDQALAMVTGWVHAWPVDENAGARAALAINGFGEIATGHFAKAVG